MNFELALVSPKTYRRSKLTAEEVVQIENLLCCGFSRRSVGKKVHVTHDTVDRIAHKMERQGNL